MRPPYLVSLLITALLTAAPSYAGQAERNKALSFFRLGEQAIEENHLDAAAKLFQQSMQADPTFYNAHLNLGLVLVHLGKNKEAIAELDETIKMKADDSAYNNRALAKMALNDYAGALKDMDQAIALNKSARRLCNRGVIKRKLGDVPGSHADFTEAVKLAPNDEDMKRTIQAVDNAAPGTDLNLAPKRTKVGDWSGYGKNGFAGKPDANAGAHTGSQKTEQH